VPLRQISVVLSDLSRRSGLSCGVSDRSVIWAVFMISYLGRGALAPKALCGRH
jgi:hypothetical protein